MADFCVDCWNKINKTNYKPRKFMLSKELYLCEECGNYKHIILNERKYYYMYKFRIIICIFKIITFPLYILWRIILIPYSLRQFKTLQSEQKNDKEI